MSQTPAHHKDMVDEYIASAKSGNVEHYMLTIARDGESPVRSIVFYQDVITAVEGYNMYQDAGFAKEYLTVSLYEPNGKITQKVIKRNQAGDPSFVRQNYIDVTEVLHSLKDHLPKEKYEDACIKIATSFGKDNWRFDAERFLKNLEIQENTGF